MYAAVPAAVEELRRADVRAVVLRGQGTEAFGAGSDISEFPEHRLGDAAASYDHVEHLAWHAVADLDRPVVAAIHGPCMGGGIAMALHADIRVAADDAQFAVPPARLGIAYPPEAVRRLVSLVGPGRAKLLLTTARVLDAEAAHHMGLVDEVVAKDTLDDHVAAMAASIARLAPRRCAPPSSPSTPSRPTVCPKPTPPTPWLPATPVRTSVKASTPSSRSAAPRSKDADR